MSVLFIILSIDQLYNDQNSKQVDTDKQWSPVKIINKYIPNSESKNLKKLLFKPISVLNKNIYTFWEDTIIKKKVTF